MLIYVNPPTSGRCNPGHLVNTDLIKRVAPHYWTFRNYGEPGSKITFHDGTKLVVTNSVQEIYKLSTEAK